MVIELNLFNLIQILGLGANGFVVILVLLIDKGFKSKSFFLKLFFFCLFIIQFVVLVKQNHFYFTQEEYHKSKRFGYTGWYADYRY